VQLIPATPETSQEAAAYRLQMLHSGVKPEAETQAERKKQPEAEAEPLAETEIQAEAEDAGAVIAMDIDTVPQLLAPTAQVPG
jgi:hypothetical protein